MSEEKNVTSSEEVKLFTKVREIILGVSPVEFLRSHEPETLAEGTLTAGEAYDITPAELVGIMSKGDDLGEDIQKLINARQLQTQLSGISFSDRETELIGKSLLGTIMFINHVVLPLLENRDEYSGVWFMDADLESSWKSVKRMLGNQTDPQDENKVPAQEILSHLVSEIQLKDPENKITPLIIKTLSRILPPQSCEEFCNALKAILSA